jgi:hypothetical protein
MALHPSDDPHDNQAFAESVVRLDARNPHAAQPLIERPLTDSVRIALSRANRVEALISS